MSTSPTPERKLGRSLNLLTLRFTRNWLKVALVVVGLYSTLPIVTPVLMQIGLQAPARLLYSLYSPFCHQFAFRSLFLFGEQAAYPRTGVNAPITPIEGYIVNDPVFLERYAYWYEYYNRVPLPAPPTVEELSVFTPWLQFAARDFIGNEQMGYKTALCARDVSIYLALFLGGLIYSIPAVRRRIRPIPIWLYVFLGLAPIGIDGLSQLVSLLPNFTLWAPRETTPAFRVLTGFYFGLMTAWLAFPQFELAMRETRQQIEAKFARAGIRL